LFFAIPFAQRIAFLVGPWSRSVEFGPFRLDLEDAGLAAISAVTMVLLFRQIARDRREQHRLAGELEAARTVQQLLLPAPEVTAAGYSVDAVYAPALEVGGDFHWRRVASDGSLVVIVGDVSGKGLKPAMLVSVAVGALRTERSSAPDALLATLNEALAGHTGGSFVTACCMRLEEGGQVSVASAGHPAPWLDGAEAALEAGLPLGVMAEARYETVSFTMQHGAVLTLVSDGVLEAENSRRELFGFDRAREISMKSAQEIAEAARAWGQNDDITVVTVRRRVAA
jgi:serine phosphatase RsbU (regulator of sigma subunit)